MRYISTRGKAPSLNFEDVLLVGLATDGGLYVPEQLPTFTKAQIADFAHLSYVDLAFNIMQPFVAGCISDEDFRAIIKQTYAGFAHKAIAPLCQLNGNEWLLELFHGPTLAFKDFALQLLGRLLDHVLTKRGEKALILGATSGDTGSAAIEGCKSCANIDIVILHPHQKISEVQRKQMTSAIAPNIHNLALEGNFDDCQELVKRSFNDQSFLNGKRLVAVNSINWARIMAQIVYYFYAAVQLGAPYRAVNFAVPTGNFGDIFAGFLAQKMGLPIEKLTIATNQNDILHRFLAHNSYAKTALQESLAPSMDIMVSSNFERLLFDLHNNDGAKIASLLDEFNKTGNLSVSEEIWQQARHLFASYAADDAAICATIAEVYEQCNMVIDPHTAIGVLAGRKTRTNYAAPLVILATAHPAKFANALTKAGVPIAAMPPHLADLLEREEKYRVLANNLADLHSYLKTV